jgi:hypothetical protein
VDRDADAAVQDAVTAIALHGEPVRRVGGSTRFKRASAARAMAGRSVCLDAGAPQCVCVPFSAGAGRHRVWGSALFSVGGLSVNRLGGDAPHIGAVAVGIPRTSLARPARRSATASVFALVGHKDDELARSMASDLARHLGITVVVTAGVHVPRARSSDIAAVLRNAKDAAKTILAQAASAQTKRRRGQ